MNYLKKLFTLPVFNDETEAQQAYLLHIIVWTLICIPIPFVIYTITLTHENIFRTLMQAAFGEGINIILLFMLHRKYVRAASILQVSAFWFFFTATAVTGAGVKSEAYLLGYGLVIIIAGILLGGTGSVIFAFLSLLAGAFMVYAQAQGMLVPGIIEVPLTTWMISFVLFPVGALLQYLASSKARNALDRARASEEKYRLISQVSSDYTFATEVYKDGSASLSWVAGAFEKMTGYSFEDYVKSGSWMAHVHPDDLEKDSQDMEKLRKNQDIKSEIRTFTKNGEIRWEQIFAHPVWDEKENRLVGIFGAVRDITEQKEIEATLAHERDLLQIFMDNIPDTVYFKDTDSRFVRINKAQAKFLGIENPQDAIGKSDQDFQRPELSQEFVLEERQILETGKAVLNRIEFNPTIDGEPRWLSATKVPVKNEAGRAIGIIGISRDVTKQKKAEELEQSRRSMLEKVIKLGQHVTEVYDLRTTLIRIWNGVHDDLGFDRIGIYLYNPQRISMDGTFGTNQQGEMIDEWHTWVSMKQDNTESKSFLRVLEKPNIIYLTHAYEEDNTTPEGHIMSGVKDFAAIAAWVGEKPVAVICVDNIITDRPIIDEQLEALRFFAGYVGLAIENARLNTALEDDLNHRKNLIKELESKNAELERFTYTVSHDLKSPLVTIRGFLGYLEKDARDGDFKKFDQDVFRIETAVEKMQALLKDLLELSRIGRLMNAPVKIPFDDIVNDALEIVHGQLKEGGIFIDYQKKDITINCDRIRMTEVLQNLIDNAIKFMGTQPSPRIEIGSFRNNDNENTFFVKDNGIGIAPEFHGKIFGLFDKLTAESDGTGIGLALVKRIIEVHGGRIWVESQAGMGTTFYFTLP